MAAAFISGQQAAQAEQQHAALLQENKLRSMVLQHEIQRMKIDDQLRAADVAQKRFSILHGQPLADMPTESVTTQQPDLPTTTPGLPM